MKFILPKSFLFLFAFLLAGSVSFSRLSAPPDSIRLEKRLSILNKKIFFDFPANATVSPRVADIMAADPNENRETRIIADWGNMRLVFFAQELFALGGKNLFTDISKEVEPDFDFQRKVLTENDSLIAVLSTPSLFDSTAGGILINSLLVKTQDNSVCRVDVYINPGGYAKKGDFTRLTENIFKTLSKGTRTVGLNAREEKYAITGGTNKFLFKLPKNYFVTIDEKYDFSVFKLAKYKDITDKTFCSITIYTGYHPALFHKDYGLTDSSAVTVKSRFLQNNVDWLYFPDPANNFYLKEQIIPSDNIEKGMLVHIALLTNKKELMEELTKIIEDIKIIK